MAGVKIVDRDTKVPGTDTPMFDFDGSDGDGKAGFHSRELDTCFPLHFCVGKESLEVFREDFKDFFEFGNRVAREGLVARNDGEDTLVPFDVTFPMDMSAEQKCFNLGGACKSVTHFCIKCATELRKETFFWEKGSGHTCGRVFCESGGGVRCRHMAVDDDLELDRKRNELRVLLHDEDWVVGVRVHIEETVKGTSENRCDTGIVNKETDSYHIDFLWMSAPVPLRVSFMSLIDKEFDLRG